MLGRADDYGISMRLLRDPGELGQRVPADRADLGRDPGQRCG
jgi:hypothetical protein